MNLQTNEFTNKLLINLILLVIPVCVFTLTVHSDFDVKVIYFKSTNAGDIDVDGHDKMLKGIQKHYQSEMTRHGYEDYTFPLQLDESGKLVIHVVKGRHAGEHYDNHPSAYDAYIKSIKPELPFEFNNDLNVVSRDNVHLIILGGVELDNWTDNLGMGFTWHAGRWGGIATVKLSGLTKFPNHYLALLAHELGHAFALDPGHNGLDNTLNGNQVAFGRTTEDWDDRMKLLKHEADLLKSRPVFRKMQLNNADVEPENQNPNKNPDLVEENVQAEDNQAIQVKPTRLKLTITWAKLKTF